MCALISYFIANLKPSIFSCTLLSPYIPTFILQETNLFCYSYKFQVEHVIREEKMMAAYDLLEIYCELIVARLPIIETQKYVYLAP